MADSHRGVHRMHELAEPAPDLVLIAGVGEGKEIDAFRSLYPKAHLVGVEPLGEFYKDSLFRVDRMFACALWSEPGDLKLHLGYKADQRASAFPLRSELPGELTRGVQCRTLDFIAEQLGSSWRNVLLWLDAEGSEAAILSAADLAHVRWLNVEVAWCRARGAPQACEVESILRSKGFEIAGVHSLAKDGRHADAVFVRREQWEQIQDKLAERGVVRKQELRERGYTDE